MDVNRIGLVIKTLRKKVGLTQQQLAEKLGVTDKAVSKWERGIGIPDISMINQLANILNIDADNLLAGNVAYLESEWVGELRLNEFKSDISLTTEVYGKPSVYFYFCYFALAGVKEVYITCTDDEKKRIEELIGNDEKYGFKLHFEKSVAKKVMVINGSIFLYGPNLTKYFQRGMAHKNAITSMVMPNGRDNLIYLDGKNQVSDITEHKQGYKILPIHFIDKSNRTQEYEPLGKGMIAIELNNVDDVMAVGNLIQVLEKYNNEKIYCLEEIVYRRGLIDMNGLNNIAGHDPYISNLMKCR